MSERISNGPQRRVNSGRPGPRTAAEREKLYATFEQLSTAQPRLNDLEIALATGVSDKTVRRWRHREGVEDFMGRAAPINETETA